MNISSLSHETSCTYEDSVDIHRERERVDVGRSGGGIYIYRRWGFYGWEWWSGRLEVGGNGRIDGQGGQGSKVNDGVDGVPDFSTIIAQQLRNLLPTIIAQVGDQGIGQWRGGYTYKEFLACNPKEYDGKGGAIVYTRWIEKMESVQDMSGCRDNQKVKYTAGSFVEKALTWWNSQIHTQGREALVGMSWEDFKTLTREEFCLSNEMQKLEIELWNHAMVEAFGHAAYD
ncbi:hypothetical protein Tco_0019846 [Tanacetum coccineum]